MPLPYKHLSAGLARLTLLAQEQAKLDCTSLEQGLVTLRERLANQEQKMSLESARNLQNGLADVAHEIHLLRQVGNWRKHSFNLFHVLGYPHSRLESIHSNLIAWLFEAEEAHGYGDLFFRLFMKKVFQTRVRARCLYRVAREEQQGADRPDIVIESAEWIVVVENKVGAAEGKDQSTRYVKTFDTRAKSAGKRVYYAWISPSGVPPESERFASVSFWQVHDLLSELLMNGERESTMIVRHFSEHLIRETGE